MLITAKLLKDHKACKEGLYAFMEAFPLGLELNSKERVVEAIQAGLASYLGWFINTFAGELPIFLLSNNYASFDLSGVDLSNLNLIGADFEFANLSYANLSGSDLRKANLYGANLTNANLKGANLADCCTLQADLTGVEFTYKQLSESIHCLNEN